MVTNGLIGATGLIGTVLKRDIKFDCEYSSQTIKDICNTQFQTLWIAAPTGNRLAAENNPEQDSDNIDQLIRHLNTVNADRIILISTVDTVHCPESAYGGNRLRLEKAIKKFDRYHIFRLCTLIDKNIRKNLLFDLCNRQYLDRICGDNVRQWYPLSDLYQDIQRLIQDSSRETNLVSPPITDQEVVSFFFPDLKIQAGQTFNPYNVSNQGKYTVTRDKIFHSMLQYLS